MIFSKSIGKPGMSPIWSISYVSIVVALICFSLVQIIFDKFQETKSISLSSVHELAQEVIEQWENSHVATTNVFASLNEVRIPADILATDPADGMAGLRQAEFEKLTHFASNEIRLANTLDFLVVSLDNKILFSTNEGLVGNPGPIHDKPELLARLVGGDNAIIPLGINPYKQVGEGAYHNMLSVFFAAPIFGSNQKVVAILALEYSPSEGLFQLFEHFRQEQTI